MDGHLPGSHGEHELQERYQTTRRARNFYEHQVLDHLNEDMRAFVGRMEMVFVATADSHGECDASFRAGLAGFVRVIDERTLMYPEYRGNGVMASLGNISENAHVGLLFIDFYRDTVGLHVNGRAHVADNDDVVAVAGQPLEVLEDIVQGGGRRPERWVVVDVEEAYIHCSKHIPLMLKADKSIAWGTDDAVRKGGDYFGARRSQPAPAEAACAGAPARSWRRLRSRRG